MTPTPSAHLPRPITIRWARDDAIGAPLPGRLIATDLLALDATLDELHDRATHAERPQLIILSPSPPTPWDGDTSQADDQPTTGPILAITIGSDQAIATWTYLPDQTGASPLAVVATNGTTNDEPHLDVDDVSGGRSEFPAWMLIATAAARTAAHVFATDPITPPGNITWVRW